MTIIRLVDGYSVGIVWPRTNFYSAQCLTSAEFVGRISRINVAQTHDSSRGAAKISKREVGRASHHPISSTTNDLLAGGSGSDKFGTEGGPNSSVIFRNVTNSSLIAQQQLEGNAKVDQGKKIAQIDSESLWNICPILLYQLLIPNNGSCLRDDTIVAAHTHAPDEILFGKANDRTLGKAYSIEGYNHLLPSRLSIKQTCDCCL